MTNENECNNDCEECPHCEIDIDIRGVDSSVVCKKHNKEVGCVIDDLDYEGNSIQRVWWK